MKKHIRWVGMAFMCVTVLLVARDKRARSDRSFSGDLAKSPYAIVMFYDKSKENMRSKPIKQSITDMEAVFESLSKDPEYSDADLLFLKVDVARDDLRSVASHYTVQLFPTFMIFIGDTPIKQARISGFASRAQLQNLIDTSLQTRINSYLKEKDAARERALQRAQIRAYNRAYWYPYGGWGWGYGYPYGGWGYGGYGFYGW